jgi:tetratricopeptide (TPR) repeat protein
MADDEHDHELGLINTAPESEPGSLVAPNEERLPKLGIGSVIPDTRLRIVRWLGQGGMGVVFEVEHLDIERRYAAKLLTVVKSPARTRRFREEARTISHIGSPWIVEIFDFKELADGRLMYLMELVPGPSLYAVLRDEGPLAPARLIGLARQVCKGLHDAHADGFVHRDVKPENIMLGVDAEGREQVKLVDFGLAALLQGPKVANNSGTPAYMSPEQCRAQDADERTDIYSLGATLYELSCGQLPFEGPDEFTVRNMHLEQPPQPPSQRIAGGLPPGLDQLILRCMAKQPSDRYESVAELEAALIELQLELRVRTHADHLPVPQLDDARRQRRLEEGLWHLRSADQLAERRRMLVGVALLVFVAIAATIGWQIEAKQRADAISLGQREIDILGDRARQAAARASWVYPPLSDPEADTAFRIVMLELEGLELPGAAAAASALRAEFANTLAALGDSYYDRDGGRQFAREFYVQALLFDPEHERASERGNISPLNLLELRERALQGDFTHAQLAAVEPLTSLAEPDPEQRIIEMEAARDSPQVPAHTAADIDRLIVDLAGKPTIEPEPPPQVEPKGPFVAALETASETEGGVAGETEGDVAGETDGDVAGETEDPTPTEAKRPKSDASVSLAKAAYDSGRDRDAETLFHRVLAQDKRNVDALVGLHRIHFDRGEWRQALEFARRAAALRPKRPDLQMYVGDSCMKVLDYGCARTHYESAKKLGDTRAQQRLQILADRLGGKK